MWRARTATPTNAAPFVSLTVPVIALVVWANEPAAKKIISNKAFVEKLKTGNCQKYIILMLQFRSLLLPAVTLGAFYQARSSFVEARRAFYNAAPLSTESNSIIRLRRNSL